MHAGLRLFAADLEVVRHRAVLLADRAVAFAGRGFAFVMHHAPSRARVQALREPVQAACVTLGSGLLGVFGFLLHPRLRKLARECVAVVVRVLAYGAVFAVLAKVLLDLFPLVQEAPASPSERPAEWTAVVRPYPAFALSMPELTPSASYAVRRHNTGGGRKHIMTFGDPAADQPYAVVELYRPGAEFIRFGEPAREIAALTAELGASRPVSAAPLPDTKFGPVDLVDFTLKTPSGPRGCTGFVRGNSEPRLQISGWYCNAGPEIVDRSMLACMIDRIMLMSAANDRMLGEFFARADLRRNFCSLRAAHVTTTRKRNDWIDSSTSPKLRGQIGGR